MKKILLTIGLIAATSAAFAQGFINFTPSTFLVTTNGTVLSSLFPAGAPNNNLGAGTVGLTTSQAGGLYYYALLITPFTGTIPTDLKVWDGAWKYSGLIDTNHITIAGRVAPGPTGLNAGSLVGWNNTPNGTPGTFPGGTNYMMLVGWSASLGTSWLQVSNTLAGAAANANYFSTLSFFGESGIGWENPTTAAPGIGIMGSAANPGGQPILIASGMTLYELPIPEPATFALVGLGGLSLLLFRRRK